MRLVRITRQLLLLLTGIALLLSCSTQVRKETVPGDRMEWWKNAKFGMFIHWGPYSQLAGEWNGRQVKVGENAEWIMKLLKIPVNEYRELAHEMNPVRLTRFNRKGGFHISKWTGPEDAVDWFVHVDKPGKFKMNITYAANKEWEGKQYEITIGKSSIEKSVICTGDWYEYHEFPVCYIDLPKAGDYTLTIRPKVSSVTYLMYLSSITLNPTDSIKQAGWVTN